MHKNIVLNIHTLKTGKILPLNSGHTSQAITCSSDTFHPQVPHLLGKFSLLQATLGCRLFGLHSVTGWSRSSSSLLDKRVLGGRLDIVLSVTPQPRATWTPETPQGPRQPHHYLGTGSFQSPLLLAFLALENSFTQTLPNKPNLTCSHLSASPAGVSPLKHAGPSLPWGTTSSTERRAPSEVLRLWGPEVCFWSAAPFPCAPLHGRSGTGLLLPGGPISSSGSNLRNNFFPWT